MLGIIDYGAGNLLSVHNAVKFIGGNCKLIRNVNDWTPDIHKIILPGVGSFGDCVTNLHQRNLFTPLRDWLTNDKPYLGICLGYQILFASSEENPHSEGLGIIQGNVVRFPSSQGIKIPHMGWNTITPTNNGSQLFTHMEPNPWFYFVHSYFPIPEDNSIIASQTQYENISFASAIRKNNIWATQFHPERSQNNGLQLLRNFME